MNKKHQRSKESVKVTVRSLDAIPIEVRKKETSESIYIDHL